MTNREAFNLYIRKCVEKQVKYMENMGDEELVRYCIKVPEYHIETNIGDKLSYFKAMTGGMPVGPVSRILEWFKQEASDDIEWERLL